MSTWSTGRTTLYTRTSSGSQRSRNTCCACGSSPSSREWLSQPCQTSVLPSCFPCCEALQSWLHRVLNVFHLHFTPCLHGRSRAWPAYSNACCVPTALKIILGTFSWVWRLCSSTHIRRLYMRSRQVRTFFCAEHALLMVCVALCYALQARAQALLARARVLIWLVASSH